MKEGRKGVGGEEGGGGKEVDYFNKQCLGVVLS